MRQLRDHLHYVEIVFFAGRLPNGVNASGVAEGKVRQRLTDAR